MEHDAISFIKETLREEEETIRAAHFAGAGGSEVVQRRTALIDRLLRDIHGRLTKTGPLSSIIAVGGYGRGELNPRSDIDILFLCGQEAERQRTPEVLYALWDAGMDIGYSVRSVSECVELGRADSKIRTSLLESRFLAGDPSLFASYLKTMKSEVFHWKPASFIAEKIAERQAVRQKFGGSLSLREPNIKESAGGLRDFHMALWISFVKFKVRSLAELVARGTITGGQYAVFTRSRNFLWRIRNELHYLSGRKNDHLTFDLQERAAADFRFRDSAHLLAVERFMKAYFIHARNVREFSSIVMHAALKRRTRLFQRSQALGPFTLVGKELIPASGDVFRDDPSRIPAAFRVARDQKAVFSSRLEALVREHRIDDEERSSVTLAAEFLALLDDPVNLSETLERMKDMRFLGRYLPEFRAIQNLARHDYYHRFTVDEHILTAVKNLQELHAGRFPALPSLREAMQNVKQRWVLMLAVLLHDLGKTFRTDHDRRSAEIAERILVRIGVTGPLRERVLFLVRHHQAMSIRSQRRELTDRRVIDDFAALVGDRENLDMLYLLTYADMAAVSPETWTQWKASLLDDLYRRTAAFLDSGRPGAEEADARRARATAAIRAEARRTFAADTVDAVLAVLPEKYILHTPVPKVLEHMEMMLRLPGEKLVIRHRHYPERGYTELTLCAYDAYGMFFRTAATLASRNLNILRAQVFTTTNGIMLDTFQVTDALGGICGYEEDWAVIHADLREVLSGVRKPPAPAHPAAFHAAAGIGVSVEFDNELSESFTIIDVTARDRIGLLARIGRALYELNLDIASARISTEGFAAKDTFYVTDLFRQKVTDQGRLRKIRETLASVLG